MTLALQSDLNSSSLRCQAVDVEFRWESPQNNMASTAALLQTVAVTTIVTCAFIVSKSAYDEIRHIMSRVTVVVIGAGPIGLVSVLVAAHSGRVSRIILYEEKSRQEVLSKPQQITLDAKSVDFLKGLGVDFDNIEGCWTNKCFVTRIGVFQEYMLSIFFRLDVPVDLRLKTKFTQDSLKELDTIFGRLVAIVSDGVNGRSAGLLGLSDEFTQHSCRAYGAFADLHRPQQQSVPTPEIRIHNLTFDLNAFGNDSTREQSPQSFHLKIFGSPRHRYMALAVPRGESKLVKMLKVVLDQSVMRNIFLACYNGYKTDVETTINDLEAVRFMKFSPRLFEIKLSQRMENVAFVEDANIFVVTEGETSRRLNYHSGMDVNLGLRGLHALGRFIKLAACAETDKNIVSALNFKFNNVKAVVQDYLKTGFRETMFT